MAVEEFLVFTGESKGGRMIARTWNGAAAGCQIVDINVKTGPIAVVEAESVGEAIKGFKQLYPGYCAQVVMGIKKSSVTESNAG